MLENTLKQFGYPETVVAEFTHWIVLCRPRQVTLGSLVLICKEQVQAFSSVSPDSFAELPTAIAKIEDVLKRTFGYDKINYLMLMMVDPEVHFHVIPRYSKDVQFESVSFKDAGWPMTPQLEKVNEVSAEVLSAIVNRLKEEFAK